VIPDSRTLCGGEFIFILAISYLNRSCRGSREKNILKKQPKNKNINRKKKESNKEQDAKWG
jgi:hypothetical protein